MHRHYTFSHLFVFLVTLPVRACAVVCTYVSAFVFDTYRQMRKERDGRMSTRGEVSEREGGSTNSLITEPRQSDSRRLEQAVNTPDRSVITPRTLLQDLDSFL